MAGLSDIPFYGAYVQRQKMNEERPATELAQYGAARKIAMDEAMRGEIAALGPNPSADAVARVAVKYGGPGELMANANRQAQTKATTEQAAARLMETARMNDSLINHRISQETNAERRLQLEGQRDQMRNYYNQKALEMGVERLFYETGTRVDASRPVVAPMPTPPGVTPPAFPPTTTQTGARPTPGRTPEFPVETPEQYRGAMLRRLDILLAERNDPNASPESRAALEREIAETQRKLGQTPAAPVAPPVGAPAAPAEAPAAASPAPVDAGNLDARDLRARAAGTAGAPAVAPAAPAAPAGPKKLTIADAPDGLSPKAKQQWLIKQTSVAGGGELSPQSLRMVAEQYLAGDTTAIQGYSRSATARIALTNAITDLATERGWKGEQIAAKIAEFQGQKAGQRSLGTRGALIQLAADEANQMADIVLETSDKFPRTNFVPANKAIVAFEKNIGSTEVREFGAALNTFINAYARAVNPTGVGTVSDKDHARELLSTADTQEQVRAVLGVLKREMEIAKRAPGHVRESMRNEVTGGNGQWRVVR